MLKSLKRKGKKWFIKGTYNLGKFNGYLDAQRDQKKKKK
jgi:hypothetical protein